MDLKHFKESINNSDLIPCTKEIMDKFTNLLIDNVKDEGDPVEIQYCYTVEEMGEYLQALSKYKRNRTEDNMYHMMEELGDVIIVICDMSKCFGLDVNDILKCVSAKIDRHLDRINISI